MVRGLHCAVVSGRGGVEDEERADADAGRRGERSAGVEAEDAAVEEDAVGAKSGSWRASGIS